MLPPTKATLSKYGLTELEWRALYARQRGKCGVCGTSPERFHIDHEHARGWKRMPPAERKKYVRGLACPRCNWRFMPVGLTGEIARGIARYLTAYEKRRDNGGKL
jgi:hypothetical protein